MKYILKIYTSKHDKVKFNLTFNQIKSYIFTPYMYLAQNIKALRKIRKLSQVELGEAFDLNKASISGYETGNSFPSFKSLLQLAEFF